MHYPDLFDKPHLDIFGWAQNSVPENQHIDKEVFITPLLNVEALSEDDVLPDLLQARASSHPRWFCAIDGRSVALGIFVGKANIVVTCAPIMQEGIVKGFAGRWL